MPFFVGAEPDTNNETKPFLSRYKEWQEQGIVCHGKFVRKICVFGVGDLYRLRDQPHFFLNKLYDDHQPLAYDCLEELYFKRTRQEYTYGLKDFDLSFYQKQPAVHYHI